MAITTTPYGSFLQQLPQTGYQVIMSDVFVCLLKNTYTPDMTFHGVYSDVSASEVANDNATGGYNTGGQAVSSKSMDYNPTTKTATLSADPAVWNALTGTVRYAVVYAQSGNALLGLIDFGEDKVFAGEKLTLSFTNGLLTLAAA